MRYLPLRPQSSGRLQAIGGEKGFLTDGAMNPAIKAGTVVAWLKQDFALGHGHAVAIVALLKGKKPEGDR